MRILASSQLLEGQPPSAVAIGVFDGVHRGHRELLALARRLATENHLESVAYTFDPHPAQVLVPARAPLLIEPVEIRLERLAGMGLDLALVERFSSAFAATPPETFVDEILVGRLHARHVVVGAGFTFGAGGRGTTDLLTSRASQHGVDIQVVSAVRSGSTRVSSTQIRTLVAQGDVGRAAELLGRPFALTGVVVRGLRRGRELGFGTANLSPVNELLPGHGVYAARASGPIGGFDAVVNVGLTPTFGSRTLKIEAHLLGFEGRDLYGTTLVVDFLERLRDERRFESVQALKDQIARDVADARLIFAARRSV